MEKIERACYGTECQFPSSHKDHDGKVDLLTMVLSSLSAEFKAASFPTMSTGASDAGGKSSLVEILAEMKVLEVHRPTDCK